MVLGEQVLSEQLIADKDEHSSVRRHESVIEDYAEIAANSYKDNNVAASGSI